MIRKAAVAGQFYAGKRSALISQIEEYVEEIEAKRKVMGIISPHAGYMFSGPVAGAIYSRIVIPETVIVMCPNHRWATSSVSIMTEGSWETPLGEVQIDADMARSILKAGQGRISDDPSSHTGEHSLEVQLPFLQYFREDFKLVPISFMDHKYETCTEVGAAIAQAVKSETEKEYLIVASTDMTHQEPQESANRKDKMALTEFEKLNPEGLYRVVRKHNISMCGFIPTVTMLEACKRMGATEAKIVRYQTSGDITGDYLAVVGYASGYVL